MSATGSGPRRLMRRTVERRMRRGVTLAELLVAAVVGGVVSTAAVVTAVRVRRASAVEGERALARAQLAQAAAVLAAELRGVAPGAGAEDGSDLVEATDSAMDVRAAVGASVACAVTAAGGGSSVDLAAGGAGVGWWSTPPRAGDVALVHDLGALLGAADDVWHERTVAAATTGAAVCTAGAFSRLGADGEARWRLALAGPVLPATVAAGAPVRVLRRRRYALYRAGDGRWYLGMREWDGAGPSGVQPLAGPFDALGAGGMGVVARDAAGAVVAPGSPATVAEIEVRLVATRQRLGAAWRDSVRVVVRPAGGGGAP